MEEGGEHNLINGRDYNLQAGSPSSAKLTLPGPLTTQLLLLGRFYCQTNQGLFIAATNGKFNGALDPYMTEVMVCIEALS
nr:hypothetical protein Itr_chr06CG19110 [Ipomoea trifida]GMD06295.1 hypothetical protein Iba_chr06bCG14670 [Ipomoea batatas]